MTKSERGELSELKQILEDAFKDKYDSKNGWKTARAVFENNTVNALEAINLKLESMGNSTDKVSDLVHSINDIQCWRKKTNKVLIWFGTSIITPIVLFIIYQALK